MSLKSFKGGIHPPYSKSFTEKVALEKAKEPELAIIPLQQHIGAPSDPIVKVGDKVKVGQKIGEASGFVSAMVHSSIAGTVKKIEAVNKHEEIEEAIIFGSRAMGNYKKGSDVDIAIKGKQVERNIIRKLNDDLNEEYPLPYFFDILNYKEISNQELKEHIDSVGKLIYRNTEDVKNKF